jgi:predicted TIM-barrel fold metal-dependent hydrolase
VARGHHAPSSRLPNVNAKISGVVAYAGPDWTVDTHPPVCRARDRELRLGPRRLGLGPPGRHPHRLDLTRWVEATSDIIAGASQDEQAKLLHRNAERIYRA